MRSRFHPLILLGSFGAFVLLLPVGYATGGVLGVPADRRWTTALLVAAAIVVLANAVLPVLWRFANSSANMTTWFTHYNAERCVGISHVEAMIAAGQYDDAAQEIDALMDANGLDRGLCLLAVDLHLGKFGSGQRAEALLRRMRAERPAEWEGFATQRLVDLYMRNSESYPKAQTELRRIMARFPGSAEATGARDCLERLRRDLSVASEP